MFIIAPVHPHLDLHRATQSACLKCLLAHAGPANALGREAKSTLRVRIAARRAMSVAFGKGKKSVKKKKGRKRLRLQQVVSRRLKYTFENENFQESSCISDGFLSPRSPVRERLLCPYPRTVDFTHHCVATKPPGVKLFFNAFQAWSQLTVMLGVHKTRIGIW